MWINVDVFLHRLKQERQGGNFSTGRRASTKEAAMLEYGPRQLNASLIVAFLPAEM